MTRVRLLPAILALAGCGYSLGTLEPVRGARSVSLPVFENRTFRRGIEADLARLLVGEVHARTPLRVLETGADLVVEGRIVNVEEIVLSQEEGQVIRESSVLVTAEFTVIDGRTGEAVRPRARITERESFVPSIGESLRTARSEVLRRLAAGIVDGLEAP